MVQRWNSGNEILVKSSGGALAKKGRESRVRGGYCVSRIAALAPDV
jgi:hypothetical protein